LPAPSEDPTTLVLKFVEGSHVRMTNGTLAIDLDTMLAEDPGLLRCANLTVDAAVCKLSALDAVFAADPSVSVTRLFTQPEADLDAERAAGRQTSGEYLSDLNLFYFVQAPEAKTPALYDRMATNPVVDTVYYQPKPVPPP
jgi:hypothetical protein